MYKLAGRVGEHRQAVVLGLGRILRGAENLLVIPVLLSFRFDDFRAVMNIHLKGRMYLKKRQIIAAARVRFYAATKAGFSILGLQQVCSGQSR